MGWWALLESVSESIFGPKSGFLGASSRYALNRGPQTPGLRHSGNDSRISTITKNHSVDMVHSRRQHHHHHHSHVGPPRSPQSSSYNTHQPITPPTMPAFDALQTELAILSARIAQIAALHWKIYHEYYESEGFVSL